MTQYSKRLGFLQTYGLITFDLFMTSLASGQTEVEEYSRCSTWNELHQDWNEESLNQVVVFFSTKRITLPGGEVLLVDHITSDYTENGDKFVKFVCVDEKTNDFMFRVDRHEDFCYVVWFRIGRNVPSGQVLYLK
jgi:hypothetical protein